MQIPSDGGMGCASVGTYFMYSPKADAVGGLKKVQESRFQKLTRDEWDRDAPCLAVLNHRLLIKGGSAQRLQMWKAGQRKDSNSKGEGYSPGCSQVHHRGPPTPCQEPWTRRARWSRV